MGNLFDGKVVIVTGSGQGVGRAIAFAFAAEGAKVVTNNRKPGGPLFAQTNEEEFAELSAEDRKKYEDIFKGLTGDAETTAKTIIESGGKAHPVFADISKTEDAKRLVEEAVNAFGTIDILCNIAGAFGGGPLTEITEEEWDRVTSVKTKGYFNVMKYAIPYMQEKKWGRIINCSSKAFMGDIVRFAHYCTANAAVVGLTQAAACEYYHEGITANVFSPWARTRNSYEADLKGGPGGTIPGQRSFPTAEDTPVPEMLTPFLLWLCTDEAADVTGTFFSLAGNDIGLHQYPIQSKLISKPGSEKWTQEEVSHQAKRALLRGYQNVLAYQ